MQWRSINGTNIFKNIFTYKNPTVSFLILLRYNLGTSCRSQWSTIFSCLSSCIMIQLLSLTIFFFILSLCFWQPFANGNIISVFFLNVQEIDVFKMTFWLPLGNLEQGNSRSNNLTFCLWKRIWSLCGDFYSL